MELIDFVREKHGEQKRKYTGDSYVTHLERVANMASKTRGLYGYEIGLCHDLFEDTDCSSMELWSVLVDLGYHPIAIDGIVNAVTDLTDVYTAEMYPSLNRKERKRLEVIRMSSINPNSQTIKYCDIMDNAESILEHDKRFAQVYLQEMMDLLLVMDRGDKVKYGECLDMVVDSFKCLS